MLSRRTLLAAAPLVLAAPRLAHATTPPDTARVLCGFPPGGTTDAVSRRIADKLRGGYARTVLVDNKAGAGGRLAVEELVRSAPDGTTLLLTPAAMVTLYPHIYLKLAYAPRDVRPVSTACQLSFGLGVGPSVPASVRTVKDFIAWAKANPGQANYASPGAGTPPHFIGALLARETGADLRHVPYRGSAPGIQDLLGGQVAAMSSPVGDYLPHLKSGKLRLLATSGRERSPMAPDVATYAEQGFAGLTMREWYGLFLPGKASDEVTQRAAAAVAAAVRQPDVVEGLAQLGLEASANTPAELAKAVAEEHAQWGEIVAKLGFKPEE